MISSRNLLVQRNFISYVLLTNFGLHANLSLFDVFLHIPCFLVFFGSCLYKNFHNFRNFCIPFLTKNISHKSLTEVWNSVFKFFQFSWNIYEIMSERQQSVNWISNLPSGNEDEWKNNQTETNTEYTQDQTSVESNTNLTKVTQDPLEKKSSDPKIFTEQIQNPTSQMQ